MDWIKLVIPLIALAVWILSNIVGSQQQQGPRRNQPRSPSPPPLPPGEGAEALEQRMEDARRRRADMERQTQIERQRQAERQAQQAKDLERHRQSERDGTRRKMEEPVFQESRQPPPLRDLQPAIPKAQLVARPAAPPVIRPLQPSLPPSALASLPPTNLSEAIKVPTSLAAPLSPVASDIRKLLANPRSLAAAIVLREILDPPVALRRRPKN